MKKILSALLKLALRNPAIAYQVRLACTGTAWDASYPRGHFYSALPDLNEVARTQDRLFPNDSDLPDAISLNEETQKKYLAIISTLSRQFPFPSEKNGDFRFYSNNVAFSGLDALVLYCFLRHFSPKKVVEVGSGFSSCLMLDTNDRYFESRIELTFVEPYPDRLRNLLSQDEIKRVTLVQKPVQDVSLEVFDRLGEGDILFIDSSHVSKIGSDVNFLFFKVLPRLRSGVIVHIHDIFWPFEYPKEWVLAGQAWNEIYLLRAFLQFNSEFEILFFNSFAAQHFKSEIEANLPRNVRIGAPTVPASTLAQCGGSFWFRKR